MLSNFTETNTDPLRKVDPLGKRLTPVRNARSRRFLDWIVRRPVVAGTCLFLITLAGAALTSVFGPSPKPFAQDEFSYLLLADTFASGRITNPTHRYWQFFETFHVFHEPTYTSKYPPAQGVVLALGQALMGHPIVAVWLSAAMMVVAVYWALLQWIEHRWALFGAGLLALQVGVLSYWSHSFWGGAVAAIGGALVIGASRTIVRAPHYRHGVLLGVGLAILANSRPVEGLVLTLVLGFYVLRQTWQARSIRRKIVQTLAPTLLIGGIALVAMGLYNNRVTGSPTEFPYMTYEQEYGIGGDFIWQDIDDLPRYRHSAMKEFYTEYAVARAERMRTPRGFVIITFRKIYRFMDDLIGPGILGLLFIPALLRDKRFRFAAGVTCLFLVELSVTIGGWPHYFAPVIAFLYLLIAGGWQYIYEHSWPHLSGQILFTAGLTAFVAVFGVQVLEHIDSEHRWSVQARSSISSCLSSQPGRDLVFVSYEPNRQTHFDWVYNPSDIDVADIVWARPLSSHENEELLEYYSDRQIWKLTVGFKHAVLTSYSRQDTTCLVDGWNDQTNR